jgi:transposase
VIADGAGRAIAFRIAPGQAHELPHALPLLGHLPGIPQWVVADRGYSSQRFRQQVREVGATPAIPPKSNEAPGALPGLDLHQPQRRRAALGTAQGVAGGCHAL